MLEALESFTEDCAAIDRIAQSGWLMALNMTSHGPEYLLDRRPRAWCEAYEAQNYFIGDPVLAWTIWHDGWTRWSDITLPDMRGVMKEARKFGMNFGMVTSREDANRRSFLSASRTDREFTDAEVALLVGQFNRWVDVAMNRATLTDGELEVLRCFRDGMGQREAADHLGVSESTIKQRANKACVKLEANTRTQAVVTAVSRGYL